MHYSSRACIKEPWGLGISSTRAPIGCIPPNTPEGDAAIVP